MLFFLLFSVFWRPFFIVTRKVGFATPGLFIFASFCSRFSLVWVVLLSGAVWRLNLISKINITNITCLLSPEGRATNCTFVFSFCSWQKRILFHDITTKKKAEHFETNFYHRSFKPNGQRTCVKKIPFLPEILPTRLSRRILLVDQSLD